MSEDIFIDYEIIRTWSALLNSLIKLDFIPAPAE